MLRLCIWPRYELRRHWLSVPLTNSEGLMMMALLSHHEVTETMLAEFLWPGEWPDTWADTMKGVMYHLRKKLAYVNGEITNRWGYGWRYTEKKWTGCDLSEDDL